MRSGSKEGLSRRDFMAASVALGIAGCGGEARRSTGATTPVSAAGRGAGAELSASEAIRRMAAGEMTVESYAEALLAGAEAAAELNAFITLDRPRVLEAARGADLRRRRGQARGRLFGLPVAIKDVIDTAGIRTTYATAALRDHVPARNAAMVDRLLAEGALILGKTNCDELSFGNGSVSSAFGRVRNPFDLEAITGGSSGGSAAAVGARVVPVAIGADTTGSIRMPAALCGAMGFRPTTGRYPGAGVWPVSPTLDTVGPMARSVADLRLLDRVLSGDASPDPEVALSGLRLGVPRRHFYDRSHDTEMLAVIERALGALRAAGAVLVEADFPDTSRFDPMAVAYPIVFSETRAAMRAFIAAMKIPRRLEQIYERFTPDVKAWFDQFVLKEPPPFDLETALSERQAVIAAYKEYAAKHAVDLLVIPATPFTAPGASQAKIRFDRQDVAPLDVIENSTAVGAVAQNPGVTIPVGRANRGLPVSIQLDALPGNDRFLLAAAAALEPVFAGALS